ncbi:hypothetical protein [Aurantibacillus circumpalustris]|uniref:hypothetical protein n=1 Tax=Aurantibacillus circumpalustris TaxID=3036359 RepID=UPI00295B739B|nr:hypothetical protein [Aurantibacillus circumpalustris]
MNNDLLVLKNKVNEVIYNPFINLKDRVKEIKKIIADSDIYKDELAKLNTAIASLDEFENLPYGNLERIKGFNKIKSKVLKIISDLMNS